MQELKQLKRKKQCNKLYGSRPRNEARLLNAKRVSEEMWAMKWKKITESKHGKHAIVP